MVTNDDYYEFTPSVKIALTAPRVALNQLGISHKQDAWTGEEYMVYRIRDIDFRGRRTDSNENTRSFGMSADVWRGEREVCQSSLLPVLGAAELEGTTGEFVYACATDPILARLLFIASLMPLLELAAPLWSAVSYDDVDSARTFPFTRTFNTFPLSSRMQLVDMRTVGHDVHLTSTDHFTISRRVQGVLIMNARYPRRRLPTNRPSSSVAKQNKPLADTNSTPCRDRMRSSTFLEPLSRLRTRATGLDNLKEAREIRSRVSLLPLRTQVAFEDTRHPEYPRRRAAQDKQNTPMTWTVKHSHCLDINVLTTVLAVQGRKTGRDPEEVLTSTPAQMGPGPQAWEC
ncbi:hypothetical protein C8T65DRAFT_695375 [Cerioporus squamosus]|nr:hypothetical protein C8T65DRAFT_695375 [Cerioporus squamosus]